MTDWYAIRTIARRERQVAVELAERNLPVFLPMEADWKEQPHVKVYEPLLPGYVFVLCELEDLAELRLIEGVIGLVRYMRDDGVMWPIAFPGRVILGLQIEERAGAFDKTRTIKKPKYRPRKNETVRITAGTYYGCIARVLATPSKDRAKLIVEGFEKPRRTTLDVAHLVAA